MERHAQHWRACAWLLTATLLWGLSFSLIKGTLLAQERLVPAGGTVFFASLAAVVRFGVAAVVMAVCSAATLSRITRSECWQGAGLAVFGGLGIVFQMDGLGHTSASTSAFLTQFYCLLIPIWAAWRQRIVPRAAVVVSSIMVLTGVAVLANVRLSDFRIGRGEAETVVASVFFAGQILWLERPAFADNRVSHFTVVMFAGIALLLAPVVALTAPFPGAFMAAYASRGVLLMAAAIILFCTLGAYTLMNRWQRYVTATEAGLIYCVEPVAASLFALVLPGWISRIADVDYPNEHVTMRLVVGGALITVANLLIQIQATKPKQA